MRAIFRDAGKLIMRHRSKIIQGFKTAAFAALVPVVLAACAGSPSYVRQSNAYPPGSLNAYYATNEYEEKRYYSSYQPVRCFAIPFLIRICEGGEAYIPLPDVFINFNATRDSSGVHADTWNSDGYSGELWNFDPR